MVIIEFQKWTIHRGIRRKSGSPPRPGQPSDENTTQVRQTVTYPFVLSFTYWPGFQLIVIVIYITNTPTSVGFLMNYTFHNKKQSF